MQRSWWQIGIAVAILLLVSFITLAPVLQNGWTNWDDNSYIVNNQLVRDSSFDGLAKLFLPSNKTMDTYTPLTLVSFALEYSMVGLDPFLYHLDNLILHLLNILLVFFIIKKMGGNIRVAFFVALLFGIHPMHVESVAWVTERKDTLFAFFFLLSILSYQNLLEKREGGHGVVQLLKEPFFWVSILSFTLSMLSKPQAACLPVVLLLFDWYKQEKISLQSIVAKLPFFAIALFFSLLALNEMMPSAGNHGVWDRILLSSYATLLYLKKLFIPLPISAHYPFPGEGEAGYPIIVYLSFFLLLVAVIVILIRVKRNKNLFFGSAFFLITLALTLHMIKVNSAIVYDRFTYISYIGLFFSIGVLLDKWFEKSKVVIGVFCLLVFGSSAFISHSRCYDWKDSKTLWNSTLEAYPNSHMAYGMRANYWMEKDQTAKALQDYITCTEKKADFPDCQNNAGLLLSQNGEFAESIPYFTKAIETDSTYWSAWFNRAVAYYNLELNNQAISDASMAVNLNPEKEMGIILHAVISEKTDRLDEALKDYDLLISKDPYNAGLYNSRGLIIFKMGNTQEALNDYNRAIKLNPQLAEAYYRRSKLYFYNQQVNLALIDAKKAQELGYIVPENYLSQLQEK